MASQHEQNKRQVVKAQGLKARSVDKRLPLPGAEPMENQTAVPALKRVGIPRWAWFAIPLLFLPLLLVLALVVVGVPMLGPWVTAAIAVVTLPLVGWNGAKLVRDLRYLDRFGALGGPDRSREKRPKWPGF